MNKLENNNNVHLTRFSFGCYGLQLIWAICNKCWEFVFVFTSLVFLFLIIDIPKPYGYIISNTIYFIFSFFALKFAYKRQDIDIDVFLEKQIKWDIFGSIVFLITLTFYMLRLNCI